jgi:NADPH:quinone reductase-like Zn-dependent oxidoreductase
VPRAEWWPGFTHTEAFSFQVATIDPAETDRSWNAIVGNGGEERAGGWCKDKWGLSWQITPNSGGHMKAAVLRAFGRAPHFEEFAEPTARDDEVIVRVRAASLKGIDRQLALGTHYASPRDLPVVCGTDAVGELEDGRRVFIGGPRRPFGTMAERTVVPHAFCFPVPAGIDDATAAAIPNPGVSAWLSLAHRGKLTAGETVLVLGATGVTGQLAVQIAKHLGASRVIGAGRDARALGRLRDLGADATIQLNQPRESLTEAFAREAGSEGFDVVLDYLWGPPTEALLSAITRTEFAAVSKETRLVQVGESAAPTISLPAAVLRSVALTIVGTAGIPAPQILADAMRQVMARAESGELRIETECVALADVEDAWIQKPESGRRVVFTL